MQFLSTSMEFELAVKKSESLIAVGGEKSESSKTRRAMLQAKTPV